MPRISRQLTRSFELVHLHLAQAFDVFQRLLRSVRQPLHGVNTRLEELLDVGRRNAVFLRGERGGESAVR